MARPRGRAPMPSAPNPQIFGAGQAGISPAITAQHRINCTLRTIKAESKQDRTQNVFVCRPGLGPGFGLPAAPGAAAYYGIFPARGRRVIPPYLYVVYSNQLYRIDGLGTQTPLGGPLLTNSGPVFMDDNGVQLGFADALGNLYVYQIFGTSGGTGLAAGQMQTFTPGALGFLGASHFAYLDNVGVGAVPGTNPLTSQQMQQSGVGDFTAWNALAFSLADSQPDPLIAVAGWKGTLIAFGTLSTEIWQDLGLSPFQFGRSPTAVAMVGCAALASIARWGNDALMVLAQTLNGQAVPAMLTAGGYPDDESNPLRDEEFVATINARKADGTLVYGTLADAVGDTVMWDGIRYYVLSFPTAGKTWAWSGNSGAWHEWTSDPGAVANGAALGAGTGVQGQYRGQTFAVFNGKTLALDFGDGHIYMLNGTGKQDTDNGAPFPMQLVSDMVFQGGTPDIGRNRMLTLNALELGIEEGVGNLAEPGSQPMAMLEISYDKGRTYGAPHMAPMGAAGQTVTRCRFTRLGSGRSLTGRLTLADPVKRVVTDEVLELEVAA